MPSHLFEELENGIAKLTLSNGSGNPMTLDFLVDLHQRLESLTTKPPRALILDAGDSKIFSGGFSLPIIVHWDRAQIKDFFEKFFNVLHALMLLPCPTIGAIGGHAIAGGFILSLGCDFRVVKKGNLKLGLSEVNLGVAVPAGTQVLFEERTSKHAAFKYAMFGELFGADEALDIGYAIAADDNPLEKALEIAATLAQKPGGGVQVTKLFHARPLAERVRHADEVEFESFLDSWFSETGQQCLKQLAAKLSAK